MINAGTRAALLFGYPVEHSFSPAMQNAAFQARGLNCVYLAVAVPPARLEGAVKALAALNLLGANVTIPHKEHVVQFLDEITPESRLLGAVNTIVNRDGRLVGYNTDGPGFLRAVRETAYDPRGESVVLLGAGGAARAVLLALVQSGVRELVIFNRSPERAALLAALGREYGVTAAAYGWGELETQSPEARAVFNRAGLVVQTTSVGMYPHTEDKFPVPPDWMSASHLAYDLVYNPAETAFMKMAHAAGARTANGLGMLLHQGAVAFELWTGEEAPVETMREVLLGCLDGSGKNPE